MRPARRILSKWITVTILVLALSTALPPPGEVRAPLSPLESRLVGDWSAGPRKSTRSFAPDGTFSTTSGQFSGVWRISEGRLTITYWDQVDILVDYNIRLTLDRIRRSRKQYTVAWDIEFTETGQRHILTQLPPRADGRWVWTKLPDR